VEIVEAEPVKEEPPEVEQVKDSWDAESSDGEEEGMFGVVVRSGIHKFVNF
jgi:hypothetical protein